jgi:uncharacterized membrane protein YgcG
LPVYFYRNFQGDDILAKKDDSEVNLQFYIPPNFTDSGKIMGMFKTRNLAEAAIFAVVPGYFTLSTLLPYIGIAASICITIFVFIPIFIFCLIGINEDSVLTFLSHVVAFFKNRKKMRFKRIYTYKTVKKTQGNAGISGKRSSSRGSSSSRGGSSSGRTRKK